MQGSILTIIESRQVGFIATDNGKEIFFECSELDCEERDKFKTGSRVEFELHGPAGSQAEEIQRVR